jgi:hypothetical protein
MISIINRFLCIVPSFTRQSYNDFESVHRIRGRSLVFIILSIVIFIAAPIEQSQ